MARLPRKRDGLLVQPLLLRIPNIRIHNSVKRQRRVAPLEPLAVLFSFDRDWSSHGVLHVCPGGVDARGCEGRHCEACEAAQEGGHALLIPLQRPISPISSVERMRAADNNIQGTLAEIRRTSREYIRLAIQLVC